MGLSGQEVYLTQADGLAESSVTMPLGCLSLSDHSEDTMTIGYSKPSASTYSLGERMGILIILESSCFFDRSSPSPVTNAPSSEFICLACPAAASCIRSKVRRGACRLRVIASLKRLGRDV